MKAIKAYLFSTLVIIAFALSPSHSTVRAGEKDWGNSIEEGKKRHKEDFCKRNPNHRVCVKKPKPKPKSCAERFPNFGRGYKNCMTK